MKRWSIIARGNRPPRVGAGTDHAQLGLRSRTSIATGDYLPVCSGYACAGVHGRHTLAAPASFPEFFQQRPRLLEVGGLKPLGEPAVDRGQERVGFGTLALLLPQATQAYSGAQLPRFRLLAAGHGEGLMETRLRLLHLLPYA